MPICFSKTLYHFVFIPAIYQSPNFSILLSIFVIICVFDFSHPCECGVMSCGFDFISLDILECELKWALESITTNRTSGGDGIPVELFQILKDDAVKVLHSICQQIRKTQQWPQDWKRCLHSNPKERQCQRMLKLLHNCTHLTC